MGRYVSFLILIVSTLACSVFSVAPEPPKVTATATILPVQVVVVVGSPTPLINVVVMNSPTNTLKPAITYVIVTSTQSNTATVLPVSHIPTATQQIMPMATETPQVIIPSTNPKAPVPTITPTPIVWAIFPSMVGSATDAIYQPFEHGFMVWRSDLNCVYAISDSENNPAIVPSELYKVSTINLVYVYCLTVAPLTDRAVTANPPSGLLEPMGVIGKVWRYYSDLRSMIGYASAPAQSYVATIPATSHEAVLDGLPFDIPQLSLPNGKMLVCGSRAATGGTCALRDGY